MKNKTSLNDSVNEGGGDSPPSRFDIGDSVEFSIGYRYSNSRPQVKDKDYDEESGEWVYDLEMYGKMREKFLKRPEGYNYGQGSRGL